MFKIEKMKPSKIIFRILLIILFLLYLSATTEVTIVNEWVDFTLMLLTLVLPIALFMTRESIWEFLKHLLILILFTVAYVYISPYITYRGEAYKERERITQHYRNQFLESMGDPKRLESLWQSWESQAIQNENIHRRDLESFEVLRFFMDSNKSIEQLNAINKLKERKESQPINRTRKLYKILVNIQEDSFNRSVKKALNYIVALDEEERSLYKIENICYLARREDGLLATVTKEEKYQSEVDRFLLKNCQP